MKDANLGEVCSCAIRLKMVAESRISMENTAEAVKIY